MLKLRLLERIRAMEKNPERRGRPDEAALVSSVMRHLVNILNTRQGSAQIAEDFGLPDFTNLGASFGESAVPGIKASIKAVIDAYEPRLSSVIVDHIPQTDNPLAVIFTLRAELKTENKTIPVLFETIIDPDGKIRVKE